MATEKQILVALLFLLTGMLLATIFFWILYSQRWLVYSNCPIKVQSCKAGDYYEDPSHAAENGYSLHGRLKIVDGNLEYRRVVRSSGCVPSLTPVVVNYPRYCLVEDARGGETIYRSQLSGHSSYVSPTGEVRTFGPSCQTTLGRGRPLAQWD